METHKPKLYEAITSLVRAYGSKFQKKHGNWIVKYLRGRQVVYMDTWNGHVYMAHCDGDIKDDGHVDVLLGKTHTIVTERECPVGDGVCIYKKLLNSIDD